MVNIELRLNGSDDSKITFWCAPTNEGVKPKKICAITVLKESIQLDFVLDTEELDELIDYLSEMKSHIERHNKE